MRKRATGGERKRKRETIRESLRDEKERETMRYRISGIMRENKRERARQTDLERLW